MIEKIKPNIWKISLSSNAYVIKGGQNILIDACDCEDKGEFAGDLREIINPLEINIVIFTHLHYDHIGNASMFQNAEFYASAQEIDSLAHDKTSCVLDASAAAKFNVKLRDVASLKINNLMIISTPGHTKGSICVFLEKEKVLFSGDTLFYHSIGRLDLPTSSPDEMEQSLALLNTIDYDTLCPGHDY